MSEDIHVFTQRGSSMMLYGFSNYFTDDSSIKRVSCSNCKVLIRSREYHYILRKLKQAGLLQGFEPKCCFCSRIGVQEWERKNLQLE